jgi:small-conductance mechanosensitive channel
MKRLSHVVNTVLLTAFLLLGGFCTAFAQPDKNSNSDTLTTKVDTITVVIDANIDANAAPDSTKADSSKSGVKESIRKSKPMKSIAEIISISKLVWALIVLVITFYGVKLIVSILDNLAERYPNNRLFIKRLVPALRIVLWSISIYFVIEGVFNPPAETVFAMLASISIAIGFASQDILKNVFGGFMIILDRPFQVGDKVDIGGHYGEVTQIGLRSCRLVTPDDSVVSVPNGELMNKSVSNTNSGALDCQVVAEVYLPQNTDPQWVREIAYKVAATSKYVYLNKPIAVIIKNEIAGSRKVMKIRVKAYVIDIRFEFPFMSEMTEIFLKECSKKNILES